MRDRRARSSGVHRRVHTCIVVPPAHDAPFVHVVGGPCRRCPRCCRHRRCCCRFPRRCRFPRARRQRGFGGAGAIRARVALKRPKSPVAYPVVPVHAPLPSPVTHTCMEPDPHASPGVHRLLVSARPRREENKKRVPSTKGRPEDQRLRISRRTGPAPVNLPLMVRCSLPAGITGVSEAQGELPATRREQRFPRRLDGVHDGDHVLERRVVAGVKDHLRPRSITPGDVCVPASPLAR